MTARYRDIILGNASQVVYFSYFVQRSIFSLDLSMRRNMIDSIRLRTGYRSCAVRDSNYFVNTKEKCLMCFTSHRRLLYTLHLDMPKVRKCSLRCNLICLSCLYTIEFSTFELYHCIISNLIEDALTIKNKKLKILECILKFTSSNSSLLYNLPIATVNKFMDCFYPFIMDNELFKNFIMNINLLHWIETYENPEVVEFLLYHANHFGRMKIKFSIDYFIFNRVSLNIGPIIKYMHIPHFPSNSLSIYILKMAKIRNNCTEEVIDEAMDYIGIERILPILQLFLIWFDSEKNHTNEESSEALRLIWCSVSDPYINFEEISLFSKVFSAEELNHIYVFYSRAVEKCSEHYEPRQLQQFCRLVIRKTLFKYNNWVPEAIKQLGLPNTIQMFLNLEKAIAANEELVM